MTNCTMLSAALHSTVAMQHKENKTKCKRYVSVKQ